ncbi:uncharacterized protein N7484_002984 [Penicillium longicatenatum]|uniref:uncharacterized protein n=1 Tax=Penicillium longicatenatum TaxID=1561947 RepID=UPI002549A703|nr:uncharacterized protein N7484_002984 [Penicillium longicatenatum]KAJ5649261.1 hypothetical protein N7484_002984 [Penicillium longicatenatum]
MAIEVGNATVAAQPTRQPSRYRSAREGTHTVTGHGSGVAIKDEGVAHSARHGSTQSSETNPSIARSMSRYRRNRPSASNTSGSTPAVPNLAQVQEAHLSGKMNATCTADEELMREKHRLDAMEQLTGGAQVETKHSYWSRSSQPQPQKRRSTNASKEKATPMQTHETPGARPTSNPPVTGERKSLLQKVKLSRAKEPHKDQSRPNYIGVGGGGIVPGIDAPISAINAGERHVRVQYSDSCVTLTITPSTLVSDLLLSAAEHFPEIDPEKFILRESFQKLSLERPLRRYEHVRDVMNSWARDSDNGLIVIPPSGMDALKQVNPPQFPSDQPGDTTFYIYHSQRRHKWDKRYVTLRADGQIFISKKQNLKDHTNICHLSDYDIYSPSARAIAKELKPPKRICFAIKSQEKSSMFLSSDNFVHFFCTNDRTLADQWYQTVQQWRSWYLMQKTTEVMQSAGNEAPRPTRTMTRRAEPNPFNDGPLVDRIPSDAEPLSRVRLSVDQHRAPNIKHEFPEMLKLNIHAQDDEPLVQGISTEEIEAETFSPSGLLGRAYTERHRSMRERQENEKRKQNAALSPGLSEAVPPAYTPASNSSMLDRSKSLSQKGKPLIDLTPVFQEQPQHTRKGRGVTVEPGMALIDAATGPDLLPSSMAIPPAVAWRRPSVPSVEVPPIPQARHRAKSIRSVRPAQPKTDSNSANHSPSSPAVPFLPNSLLANVPKASPIQGQPIGHGVATGDRNATRPMLDMSPENPFAEGSLLRKL